MGMVDNYDDWTEIGQSSLSARRRVESGRLRLRSTIPIGVVIEQNGVETLAEFGRTFDARFASPITFTLIWDGEALPRVWIYEPFVPIFVSGGEVFTNLDRQPYESGSMLEVSQAVRRLKLEQLALMRQMRAEREALEAARRALSASPEVEPEVEPEVSPEASGDASE